MTSATPPPPPVVELGTVPVTDDLHRFVIGPFDPAAAQTLTGGPTGARPAVPADGADPVRAALAGRAGVVDVQPIGDGRYAVAATMGDALAGTGLAVTPDPQVVFAGDPYEGYQWTLDNTGHNLDRTDGPPPQRADADIDGREAASARGAGVVVAVIDSGADMDHPDLAAAQWTNSDESCGNGADDDRNGYVDDCRGWDFGNQDNQPYAAGSPDHATHVAGIIAAQPGNGIGIAGIAPAVKIMNLSVAGPGGMTVSGVARAVRYAVDNGADIVNLSLGTTPGTPAASVQPLFDAVAYAQARGVLLVAAAGNSNADIGATAVYPASIPGANMLVVGASAPDDTRASFSNYGSPVDIFAPGMMIASTMPNRAYGFMSGTSQAAPTTAATAALVLGRNPGLSPAQVIAQLVGTADQIGPLSSWVTNGVRLNAARAIGMMAGAGTTTDVSIAGLATTGGHLRAEVVLDEGPGFDRPYRWEATMVALRATGGGGTTAYGLVGLPVTVEGEQLTTDGRGAVALAAGGSGTAALTAHLPAGSYGLVVEAVPIANPSMRLGQPFAATFEVTPTPGSVDGAASTTPATTATTASPITTATPGSSPTTRAATVTTTVTTAGPTAGGSGDGAGTGDDAPGPATTGTTIVSATPTSTPTGTGTRDGGWTVSTISPPAGPVAYGTVVSIAGSFPEAVYVWFGDQQGQVLYQSSSWILVTTPPAATAGTVEVTLATAAGPALTLPGAFTFGPTTSAPGRVAGGGTGSTTATTASAGPPSTALAPGGTSPTTVTPTSGGSTPTSSGGTPASGVSKPTSSGGTPASGASKPASSASKPASSASKPTSSASKPTSGGGAGPSSTTSTTRASTDTAPSATMAAADPALSPRAVTAGTPVDLGGGLSGVAFSGWTTLGSVALCASDPCRTRSI